MEYTLVCAICGNSFTTNKIKKSCSNSCKRKVYSMCVKDRSLVWTVERRKNMSLKTQNRWKNMSKEERIRRTVEHSKKLKEKYKNLTVEERKVWGQKRSGYKQYKHTKFLYNNIFFRSSWEVIVAKLLDEQNIIYEYEKYSFILNNNKRYTPDFYLPEKRIFIEVKGYWTDISKTKRNLFTNYCKENNYKYFIIDEINYKNVLNKTINFLDIYNPNFDEYYMEGFKNEYFEV